MTTYYLRADGVDTNTGLGQTAGTAWKTLNKACSVAGAGDRVEIMDAGGVFFISSEHDFNPVGAVGNYLIITNFAGDSPIFDGTGGTFGGTDAILSVTAGSEYADIGGFTVRNNAQGSALGRGMEIESSISPFKAHHLIFRDIVIHDVWERGFGGGGNDITLINVEIYFFCMRNENQALGGGGWASGLASYSYSDDSLPTNWLVQNCYVHHGWGEGIITLRVTGFTIEDTTVENAFSKTIYVDKGQDIIIRRCRVLFNDATYQRDGHNSDGITFAVEGSPLHGDTHEVDNVQIYNNMICGVRGGITWFTDSDEPASTYRNVKIWNNSFYALVSNGMRIESIGTGSNTPTGCEVRNNSFDLTMSTLNNSSAWTFSNNRWDTIPSVGTHTNSITTGPDYTSPSTSNTVELRVDSDSPLLGAGIVVASVTTDYDGDTRPNPPAIGAFEEETPPVLPGIRFKASFLTK